MINNKVNKRKYIIKLKILKYFTNIMKMNHFFGQILDKELKFQTKNYNKIFLNKTKLKIYKNEKNLFENVKILRMFFDLLFQILMSC